MRAIECEAAKRRGQLKGAETRIGWNGVLPRNPSNPRSTALNRVCSIFAQLLQFLPRMEFEAAVAEHQAERHARGFSSWTQFVAMLFCQLGHAQSLREITQGLAASEGRLRHLGVKTAPSRSTL